MEIRPAAGSDQPAVIALAKKSQAATGIPDPKYFPPSLLADWIYSPRVLRRFVAVQNGRIVGHALIEQPNPDNLPLWQPSAPAGAELLELGGSFVDPDLMGRGIWTKLLEHRLAAIRQSRATPVSATWMQNEHVKRTFRRHGGTEVASAPTPAGYIALFVFL